MVLMIICPNAEKKLVKLLHLCNLVVLVIGPGPTRTTGGGDVRVPCAVSAQVHCMAHGVSGGICSQCCVWVEAKHGDRDMSGVGC